MWVARMAALQPHQGHVALEHSLVHRKWDLVHCVTFERAPLQYPLHEWQLVFDAEGFGMLYSEESAGAEISLDVDDVLDRAYYTNEQGEQFAVSKHGQQYNLSRAAAEHGNWHVFLPLGFTNQKAHALVGIFKMASLCCRVRWLLPSLFSCLGISNLYKQASQWYLKMLPKWAETLKRCHIPGQTFRGMLRHSKVSGSGATVQPINDGRRSLRLASLDTVALVAILSRGSFLPFKGGGSPYEAVRLGYKEMLEGLAKGLHGSAWKFQLALDPELTFQWPALPLGANTIVMEVDIHAMVNLEPLHKSLASSPKLRALGKVLQMSGTSQLSMVGLLQAMVKAQHLAAQIFHAFGTQLDSIMAEQAAQSPPGARLPNGTGFHMKCADDAPIYDYQHRDLAIRQIAATKAATDGQRHFTLGLDKSRGYGQRSVFGAVVLENIMATWTIPQVGTLVAFATSLLYDV